MASKLDSYTIHKLRNCPLDLMCFWMDPPILLFLPNDSWCLCLKDIKGQSCMRMWILPRPLAGAFRAGDVVRSGGWPRHSGQGVAERLPYFGLTLSETHGRKLELQLTDYIVAEMKREGSTFFRPEACPNPAEAEESEKKPVPKSNGSKKSEADDEIVTGSPFIIELVLVAWSAHIRHALYAFQVACSRLWCIYI